MLPSRRDQHPSSKVVPSEPLQAKQSCLPQPLFRALVFQDHHQLCCPCLDTIQYLSTLPELRGPKQNTGLKVQPHSVLDTEGQLVLWSCWPQYIIQARIPLGFLATWIHTGSCLSGCQPIPLGPFPLGTFPATLPKAVVLHGVIMTQEQDLALYLIKPHTIGIGPLIQPAISVRTPFFC